MCKFKREYILPTAMELYVHSNSDLTQYRWMIKYSIWSSSYLARTPCSNFDLQMWCSVYSCGSYIFVQFIILLGTQKIHIPRRYLLKQSILWWHGNLYFLQSTLNDSEVDCPWTTLWDTTNSLDYICNTNWKNYFMPSYLCFTMCKGLKTSIISMIFV